MQCNTHFYLANPSSRYMQSAIFYQVFQLKIFWIPSCWMIQIIEEFSKTIWLKMMQNCKNLDTRHIGHFSEIFVPISKVRLPNKTNAKMLLFLRHYNSRIRTYSYHPYSLLSNSNDFWPLGQQESFWSKIHRCVLLDSLHLLLFLSI